MQLNMNFRILISSLILSCFIFCAKDPSRYYPNNIQNNYYTIKVLDYFDLPYTSQDVTGLEIDYYADSNGVPLFNYKGRDYYNPVSVAQRIFPLLNSYVLTNDTAYLARAEQFTKVLYDLSYLYGDARFFPYEFDYGMHANESTLLLAPWYSGMAQGHLLTVYSRLYQLTHNPEYLEICSQIFNSFDYYFGESDPWIGYIDSLNFYWIEEYPINPPDHTLNGFIFAIYGLYDYYMINKSIHVKTVLDQAISTIEYYISYFRNPGGSSYYCLKHKHIDTNYHYIHIQQLKCLYKMTGEPYFSQMADSLKMDYY